MNKKFLGVIASATVAAGFIACGSGEIYEPSITEQMFLETPPSGEAMCALSGGCDGAFVVPSSASVESSSAANHNTPMSSIEKIEILTGTSSSLGIIGGGTASSSSAVVTNGVGTCAPTVTPIKEGGSTGFKFVAATNNASFVTSAKFSWNFGANATPAASTSMSPNGITFNKSGSVVATVDVTYNGQTTPVPCSPLQVNGPDITGCECGTEATSVDFTASPDVSWSVTGCKTATTTKILTYSWNGGAMGSEASFTKTFDEAQAGWAPTLTVANDENTIINVPCPAVKTTAGPEYLLSFEGDQIPSSAKLSTEIPFNVEACINVSFDWTNSGYSPTNISVLCDVTAAQGKPGLTMDVKYGTSKKSYTGDYNISNSGIALGAIKAGKNDKGDVCVTVTGTEGGAAKCFFGN